MSPPRLPEPSAQGDLARTPFAHAVLYVHQRALTGTLVVWAPANETGSGQDRVYFDRGVPTKGRLVHRATQLDRGLLALFPRRDGPYAFYEGVDLVGEGELVREQRIEPLALVAASLRGPSRDDVVDQVLDALGDTKLRFRAGVDPERYQLLPKERSWLDVVRASPADIGELATACELGPQMGRRLVYLLVATKAIEPWSDAPRTSAVPVPAAAPPAAPAPSFSEIPPATASSTGSFAAVSPSTPRASLPPSRAAIAALKGRGEDPPPPPPEVQGDALAFWKEVQERWRSIDGQNYFEMLGIGRDAGSDAVRKAYFGLVKRWHPDRVTAELAPLRPFVERIFHHFTQAQEALLDDKKRAAHLRSVQDGGGTPESERKLSAILQAAMEHQKAEVLIRRRDFEGALAILDGALELSPDEADGHAARAWCLFNLSHGKDRVDEMLAATDRALAANPDHDRAHYVRGMTLRRAGREHEAVQHFQKAAAANPKNIDAVREVRLAQMRSGSAAPRPSSPPSASKRASKPPPATTSGLFGKLFGSTPKKDGSK